MSELKPGTAGELSSMEPDAAVRCHLTPPDSSVVNVRRRRDLHQAGEMSMVIAGFVNQPSRRKRTVTG